MPDGADGADGTGLMVTEEVEDDTRWGSVHDKVVFGPRLSHWSQAGSRPNAVHLLPRPPIHDNVDDGIHPLLFFTPRHWVQLVALCRVFSCVTLKPHLDSGCEDVGKGDIWYGRHDIITGKEGGVVWRWARHGGL